MDKLAITVGRPSTARLLAETSAIYITPHTQEQSSVVAQSGIEHRQSPPPTQQPDRNWFMAFFKADKMKQRLQSLSGVLSCSSAASTSVVAFSSGRAIDRHSPHLRDPHRRVPDGNSSSSAKLKNKKKTTVLRMPPQPTSPASSSRFLLNSSRLQQSDDVITVLDTLPPPSFIEQDFAPVITEQAAESPSLTLAEDDDGVSKAVTMMRSCSTRSQHQMVVLKVSLHCKGCAGKVKKHISKMEGVTSFDIDIATKKVTVLGDVTPLGVLNCISKVKSAQFWPASSSSPPRASASF